MESALALILLAGCSFFSKTKNQIYSLDRGPGAAVAVAGAPVGIDAIEVPPGFDRKAERVIDFGPHVIVIDGKFGKRSGDVEQGETMRGGAQILARDHG